jgi:hypothetical protein
MTPRKRNPSMLPPLGRYATTPAEFKTLFH